MFQGVKTSLFVWFWCTFEHRLKIPTSPINHHRCLQWCCHMHFLAKKRWLVCSKRSDLLPPLKLVRDSKGRFGQVAIKNGEEKETKPPTFFPSEANMGRLGHIEHGEERYQEIFHKWSISCGNPKAFTNQSHWTLVLEFMFPPRIIYPTYCHIPTLFPSTVHTWAPALPASMQHWGPWCFSKTARLNHFLGGKERNETLAASKRRVSVLAEELLYFLSGRM